MMSPEELKKIKEEYIAKLKKIQHELHMEFPFCNAVTKGRLTECPLNPNCHPESEKEFTLCCTEWMHVVKAMNIFIKAINERVNAKNKTQP